MDWVEAATSDGKVYYYHRDTRETCWELPQTAAPPPPALAGDGVTVLSSTITSHPLTSSIGFMPSSEVTPKRLVDPADSNFDAGLAGHALAARVCPEKWFPWLILGTWSRRGAGCRCLQSVGIGDRDRRPTGAVAIGSHHATGPSRAVGPCTPFVACLVSFIRNTVGHFLKVESFPDLIRCAHVWRLLLQD